MGILSQLFPFLNDRSQQESILKFENEKYISILRDLFSSMNEHTINYVQKHCSIDFRQEMLQKIKELKDYWEQEHI